MVERSSERRSHQRRSTASDYNEDLSFDRVASPKHKKQAQQQIQESEQFRINPGFERDLPHAIRGQRLLNQTDVKQFSERSAAQSAGINSGTVIVQQPPEEKKDVFKPVNSSLEEEQQNMVVTAAAGPSIWLQNNSNIGGGIQPQPVAAKAERKNVNQSCNLKLNYEQMPRQESEIDSARMTIDLDRNRKHVQNGSAESQSMPEDEQPSIDNTVIVLNSEKVHEQRGFNDSSDLRMNRMLRGQHQETPLVADNYTPLVDELEPEAELTQSAGSAEGVQPIFLQNHHHQSQSLGDFHNLQTHNSETGEVEVGQAPSRLKANQTRIITHQSGQFDLSEADGVIILGGESSKLKTIDISRSSLGNQPLDKDLSVSEFAFTELHQQQNAEFLTSQQSIAERSETIREPVDISAVHREDTAMMESVTDTHKVAMLPKREAINHSITSSVGGLFVSETEPAASIKDSINARRSEQVLIDTFAEENSQDWHNKAAHPQSTDPLATHDYYELKNKQIKSQHSSKANSMRGISVGAPPSNDMGSARESSQYTPAYEEEDEEDPDQRSAGPRTEATPMLTGVGYESASDDRYGSAPLRDSVEQVVSTDQIQRESMDNMEQGDLFESVQKPEEAVMLTNPSRDYLEHEFNSQPDILQVQDHLDGAGSQIETVGVQPSGGSGMLIVEEKPWVITKQPSVDGDEFTHSLNNDPSRPQKHSREIKSFEIKNKAAQAHFGTEKLSGVEQYESDDNVDGNMFGSVQQTSITNDGPQATHKFTYPHTPAEEDSAMLDSMAFDTMQKDGHEMSLSYEKEGIDDSAEYEIEAKEHDLSPQAEKTAAISVLDDSDKAIDEVSQMRHQEEFSPLRSTQPVLSQDELSEALCASQKSHRTHDSKPSKGQKQLVKPRTQGQSPLGTVSKEINILDESELAKGSTMRGSSKDKQISILRRRTEPKKSKKKNSKSPKGRNSQSPRQHKLHSKKKSTASKSPSAEGKKYVIKNGRGMLVNNPRNTMGERHQFPIRKSNYNPRTVEQMLMNKHSFQESERMMQRMKSRIQKYNDGIVPFAQHYYMAMQHPEPFPLKQGAGEFVMAPQQPIDENSNSQSTPFEHPSTINNMHIPSDSPKQDHQVSNLPQFLKNVTRARQDSPWTAEGINNIQVATSAEFSKSRGNSNEKISTAIPMTRPHKKTQRDQLLGAYSLETHQQHQIKAQSRQAPGTAIAVQRDSRSRMTAEHDAEVRIEERAKSKDNQMRDQNSTSSAPETPQTQSELRFRAKKPNRRLVAVNRNIQPQQENKRRITVATEQSSCVTKKTGDQQSKSTRSSFYPQENLSFLLHANPRNAPSDSISTQHGGGNVSLAQKMMKNNMMSTGKKQRALAKNWTIEKIYADNGGSPGKSVRNNILPTQVKIRAGQLQQLNSMPDQNQRYTAAASLHGEVDMYAGVSSSHERATLPSRTTGCNSQRNLNQWPTREQKNNSMQPSEHLQRSVQDSGRLIKQRLSTRERMNGSVMKKFQRWLDKGQPPNHHPTSNSSLPSRSGRRNLQDRLKATTARVNVIGDGVTSKTPNQPGDIQTEIDANDTLLESFEVRKGSIQNQEAMKKQFGSMKMTNAITAKILEDPRLGNSVDQRKMRLRQMMKHQYRDEFISLQQANLQHEHPNNPLFSSVEIAMPTNPRLEQTRQQRGIGRIMVKTNASSGESQPIQQNKTPHLSRQHQQLLRQSLQPNRQYKPQLTSEVQQRVQLNGKLNNLSSIYAVPQGKKQRMDFLRDNYVKARQLEGASVAKNAGQSRYSDVRNSHSPTQQLRSSQENSVQKSQQNQQKPQKRKQPQIKRSDSASVTTSSRVKIQPREIVQTPAESRRRSEGETPGAVEGMEMDDSYGHPQITLNVGFQPSPHQEHESQGNEEVEQIQVGDDEVNISQAKSAEESDGEHQIDHLQELEILDDEDKIKDVPVVIAEDEVTSPGRTEDPILGEQSISEDEAGEVAQKRAMEQTNTMSYHIEADTEPTHRSQPAPPKENPLSDLTQLPEEDGPESQGDNYELQFDDEEPNQLQPLSSDQNQEENDEDTGEDQGDEEEEEEDYYADDKFVYEDNAEDPSSEDPEQKFLKQQARKVDIDDDDDEEGYSEDPDAAEEDNGDSDLMEKLERDTYIKQQKPTVPYNDRPTAAGLNALNNAYDMEEESGDDEDDGGEEDNEEEDYENEDFENDQNDNEDAYSAK